MRELFKKICCWGARKSPRCFRDIKLAGSTLERAPSGDKEALRSRARNKSGWQHVIRVATRTDNDKLVRSAKPCF